ncbi:ABC transporter substrate-binding protein [Bacillus solitudinis]|uniref:ABC transporter substrate-binding protein n=1 Tax=Bacillus solitudinis TaxID=2014074 RepID=UPI000C2438CA|nr:sugar ABC transporter substrate-binding protein [Bacillus solitudinis]
MKHLKFLGVFLFIVAMLAGCGGSDSASEQEELENPEEISGDITVWAWALEANYLEQDVLPLFQKKYPNINVTVNNIGVDQVYQRLNAGLSSGGSGLPDVVQVENNRINSFTDQFPDAFANLTDMGYDEYDAAFPEGKWAGLKDVDGNIIAMPRDLGPVGVMYRTDIFEEAGVDPEAIETWDDYIEAGKQVVEHTGNAFLGMYDDNLFRILLQQQGSYYFTNDEDGHLNLTSEEAANASELLTELKDAGLIAYTDNWDGQVAAMKNGQVATHPDAVWWSGTMLEQMPELSGNWGMFELPAFEEGGVRASNNGGSALAIPSNSNNKVAAYMFAEFATTNIEAQTLSLQNRGLFPSLLAAYDEPFFSEDQEFFNNKPFFQQFADTVPNIPAVNHASDELAVRQIMLSSIEAFLLEDQPIDAMIQSAEEQAQRQTGRDVAE